MLLNKKKCGIIIVSRNKKLSKSESEIGNILGIPLVETYKYLGVTLDKSLSPAPHLEKLKIKIKKYDKLAIILRLQKQPSTITRYLYILFAQSSLNYANIVFQTPFST